MSLVNVPPGAVHAFAFERGTQGWVVTLADDLIEQLLGPAGEERHALAEGGVLAADPGAGRADGADRRPNSKAAAPSRALVLQGLCAVLLGQAARAAARAAPPPRDCARLGAAAPLRRAGSMRGCSQHRTVADCARALAVTPTHLSRVLRAATGQPASRLIEARLMREARRQLAYTSLQVSTIAYTLGFADPAYFSRVFSRVEGLSPRAFRERLVAGATPRQCALSRRGRGGAHGLVLLVLAGLFEVGWAIGLKYTDGFTRLWPTVGTVLAMIISLGLLGLAMKSLPVGTSYAVWVGVGAVGTAILGIVLLGEPANLGRLLSLGLIVAGIVGLKLASPV